jgi:hypothetical protein
MGSTALPGTACVSAADSFASASPRLRLAPPLHVLAIGGAPSSLDPQELARSAQKELQPGMPFQIHSEEELQTILESHPESLVVLMCKVSRSWPAWPSTQDASTHAAFCCCVNSSTAEPTRHLAWVH